ncbi:MAG: hypothetical protein H7039_17995, partial [Bryobacteraceae bacterium]|nr:hypothetical protein [Bryobacteraceae bacterium]
MFWRIFTGILWVSLCSRADEVKLVLLDVTVGEFETSMLLPEGFQFSSGMPVYLSFAVGGYTIDPDTNGVSLAYTVEALDCLGHSFGPPINRRYARRFPLEQIVAPPVIRTKFMIPQFVYPGMGKFRVTVTDLATRSILRQEIEFEIGSTL